MTAPLVALDARMTRQMSVGMKSYVRHLVARLPAVAADLSFCIVSNEPALCASGSGCEQVTVSEFVARNGAIGEQLLLAGKLRFVKPALIHYMSVYAPRFSPAPFVYTIHDLIHLRYPHYFSRKVPPYYRLVVGPVARKARLVITDAQATVPDLQRYLGVRIDRTRVIPLGIDEEFARDEAQRAEMAERAKAHFGLERPYFLYAGNHRQHKNLATLIEAWHDKVEGPIDLVITEDGELDVASDRQARFAGRIHATGHVATDELIGLYAGCIASVQPSLYEGFGLSVLESMACGAPAVVAQTPALVEIGGNAIKSFPPTDANALGRIMNELATNEHLRIALREAGQQRVADFSWDLTARQTASVYREALQL